MKLLLIVPNWKWCEEEKNVNYPYPPYNLCLLAAIIRNKKICSEISVVDCDVDDKSEAELRTIISEKSPDVVGTTVLMDQLRESGHIVTRIAKEVNKDIVTISKYLEFLNFFSIKKINTPEKNNRAKSMKGVAYDRFLPLKFRFIKFVLSMSNINK